LKEWIAARRQWLMPVILTTREDFGSKPAQANRDHILKKPITEKGLVEWLNVQALSSNPYTTPTQNEWIHFHPSEHMPFNGLLLMLKGTVNIHSWLQKFKKSLEIKLFKVFMILNHLLIMKQQRNSLISLPRSLLMKI
jgi:hypothetical protein